MKPLQWLALGNAIWFLGGALAYYTSVSAMLGTVVALVVMLPGLRDQEGVWADRALSAAIGTWALCAMLIVIPYAATENGVSLWELKSYAVTGLVIASLGMGLTNLCAAAAAGLTTKLRIYLAGHVLLLAGALYWASQETATSMLSMRGDVIAAIDLALAPATITAAGVMWALVFYLEKEPSK